MKKSAKAAALMLPLVTSIPTTTQGATQTLTAAGTVTTVCAFDTNNPGVLAVSPGTPNRLATDVTGGTPITFNISYLGTPTLSIPAPTGFDTAPAAASNLSPTFSMELTSAQAGQITPLGNNMSRIVYTALSSDQLTLNMIANFGNASTPMGSYQMSTVATCQ